MKTLILLFIALSSTLSFACADLKHKPKYMTQDEIKCGKLWHTIVHPKLIVGGKTYPFAMDMGDMWGDCPADNQSCYPPLLNSDRRANAICKAYGFGRSAKWNSYSPLFHSEPDVMARLKRVNPTTFAPSAFRMNHSRADYSEVREIWCIPNYQKR